MRVELPSLLLPHASRSDRAAPSHSAAFPAANDPADIEISIGRLEVRTNGSEVQPQRSPPAPAPASPFISLDDYLKGRRAP